MTDAAEHRLLFDTLDLREQLARIDRAQAETRKFAAEHEKLAAEAMKFRRDYRLAYWLAGVAAAASLASFAAALVTLLHFALK